MIHFNLKTSVHVLSIFKRGLRILAFHLEQIFGLFLNYLSLFPVPKVFHDFVVDSQESVEMLAMMACCLSEVLGLLVIPVLISVGHLWQNLKLIVVFKSTVFKTPAYFSALQTKSVVGKVNIGILKTSFWHYLLVSSSLPHVKTRHGHCGKHL